MELDFSKNIQDSKDLGGIFQARKSQAHFNELPDSDFAYIEAGGKIDFNNRTVPRSLRHFPVSSKDEVIQSIKELEASSLSSGMQIAVFNNIHLRAEKLGMESQAGLPPWLEKKSEDKKSGDKKSEDKKSEDKKSGDKSDKKDESKAELSKQQKKLPPAIQKSILEKQKKSGDKDEKKDSKDEPKEESDAMKMEKDDAMMKKMYSRMDEIKKARKDMDKEYAMIKDKLGAMMKKVRASSSEND